MIVEYKLCLHLVDMTNFHQVDENMRTINTNPSNIICTIDMLMVQTMQFLFLWPQLCWIGWMLFRNYVNSTPPPSKPFATTATLWYYLLSTCSGFTYKLKAMIKVKCPSFTLAPEVVVVSLCDNVWFEQKNCTCIPPQSHYIIFSLLIT